MRRIVKTYGFTLIEMLIVVAIIVILSGVVLTGVGGFRATARDASRISDIRNIQTLVELHFTRNDTYPTSLNDKNLTDLGRIPKAPKVGDDYEYETWDGVNYCIKAQLESDNSAAEDDSTCEGASSITDCGRSDVFCAGSD